MNNIFKNTYGFTLIEILIILSILGVLTVVAIPAYQDYIIKARVTEGVQFATVAKIAISESIIENKILPKNQGATYYVSPSATENVANISIEDGTANIIITYTAVAGGGTIIFTPTIENDGGISWACNGGSVEAKHRPTICR